MFFALRPPLFRISSKMKLKVNNTEKECRSENITGLVSELNMPDKGIAVAVNKKMVPRAEWASHVLKEGDEIIVIKAVCGG